MSIKLLFITTVIKPHKYVIVLSYILISLILTLILFLAAYFLAPKKSYNEKNSAYECGFEPFGDAKSSFDIQFYTVTMLFIIFDLEIAYLYPWAMTLGSLGSFGCYYWSMVVFLLTLTLGFIYEYRCGALSWSKK